MMKKAISLLLSSVFLFGAGQFIDKRERYNNYNSNSNSNNSKSSEIYFNGKITNIRDYRDYYQYTIKDNDLGYIYIRLSSNRYKENSFISGSCRNKEYSEYVNCYVQRSN